MNPETIDRIEEAVEPLADLAQQGAEFSWEALVRQVIIEGFMYLGLAVLMVAILAIALVAAKRCYAKYNEVREAAQFIGDGEGWMGGVMASLGVAAFAFLFLVGSINGAVPRLLNPGYYALQEVAKMVGAS